VPVGAASLYVSEESYVNNYAGTNILISNAFKPPDSKDQYRRFLTFLRLRSVMSRTRGLPLRIAHTFSIKILPGGLSSEADRLIPIRTLVSALSMSS